MKIRLMKQKALSYCEELTILFMGKMAAISKMTFSNAYSWMKMWKSLIRTSLKIVPNGPADNKSALVQVTVWCRTGERFPQKWTNIPEANV